MKISFISYPSTQRKGTRWAEAEREEVWREEERRERKGTISGYVKHYPG